MSIIGMKDTDTHEQKKSCWRGENEKKAGGRVREWVGGADGQAGRQGG